MQITNEKLYELCKKYGTQAKLWRQKFIGLLPEVNRRRLYEQKGFSSIFEFSAKLCGLSEEQVRLALNLEKRFRDKPILKKMLESGEASINKLSRIVSIATPENQQELAQKVKILPKNALDTFVRDVKGVMAGDVEMEDGSQKPLFDGKDLPGQTLQFQLSDDVTNELNKLSAKGIDVNELLRQALKRRRVEIEKTKEEIAEAVRKKTAENGPSSRYIPVKIRKILQQEFGEKCSIDACRKLTVTIHHTQRFSLSQNHDPHFLAPLCRDHHVIAHSIDAKYQHAREFAAR